MLQHALAFILINGLSILSLGLSALLGYMFRIVNWYQWYPNYVAMAPNSAVAFIFCGLTFIVISFVIRNRVGVFQKQRNRYGPPYPNRPF